MTLCCEDTLLKVTEDWLRALLKYRGDKFGFFMNAKWFVAKGTD